MPPSAHQIPWVLRQCGRLWLWAAGWEVVGARPSVPRAVFVAAPHTSNWDMPFMTAVAWAMDMKLYWMGKHTLFRGVWGGFFRWFGGIPVDRRASQDTVRQVGAVLRGADQMFLAVAPEGTRSLREHWRSGFYHIAREAQVPIACGFLDFRRKRGGVGPVFETTGDPALDMERLRSFYVGIDGAHPELQGPIRLQLEDGAGALQAAR
jgi:1-acyl-sn-glycerol-3-phosphate acyltransferase